MATTRTSDKNYAAIAKRKISKPSQRTRHPRFHIYGGNKKGKTWFTATAPRNLIVDPEQGTDQMTKQDPDTWPISRWEDFNDVYNYARSGDHPYEFFTLDGMTKINNLGLRYIMRVQEERDLERRPGIIDRRDYFKSGELVKGMLTNFFNLPYGLILTSHERQVAPDGGSSRDDENEETQEDDEVEQVSAKWVADLPKGVRGHVNSLVDVIGRIYVVRVDVDGSKKSQRRLWIGESEKYDTGYRSNFGPLPDMIKYPTVPKLTRLIRTGSSRRETASG